MLPRHLLFSYNNMACCFYFYSLYYFREQVSVLRSTVKVHTYVYSLSYVNQENICKQFALHTQEAT